MSALLSQLDGYQRRGRPLEEEERELLVALGQRMVGVIGAGGPAIELGSAVTAAAADSGGACRSVGGARSSEPLRSDYREGPQPNSSGGVSPIAPAASADRSTTTRYSTPNLALSSNFGLILRQQDRVSSWLEWARDSFRASERELSSADRGGPSELAGELA